MFRWSSGHRRHGDIACLSICLFVFCFVLFCFFSLGMWQNFLNEVIKLSTVDIGDSCNRASKENLVKMQFISPAALLEMKFFAGSTYLLSFPFASSRYNVFTVHLFIPVATAIVDCRSEIHFSESLCLIETSQFISSAHDLTHFCLM